MQCNAMLCLKEFPEKHKLVIPSFEEMQDQHLNIPINLIFDDVSRGLIQNIYEQPPIRFTRMKCK